MLGSQWAVLMLVLGGLMSGTWRNEGFCSWFRSCSLDKSDADNDCCARSFSCCCSRLLREAGRLRKSGVKALLTPGRVKGSNMSITQKDLPWKAGLWFLCNTLCVVLIWVGELVGWEDSWVECVWALFGIWFPEMACSQAALLWAAEHHPVWWARWLQPWWRGGPLRQMLLTAAALKASNRPFLQAEIILSKELGLELFIQVHVGEVRMVFKHF